MCIARRIARFRWLVLATLSLPIVPVVAQTTPNWGAPSGQAPSALAGPRAEPAPQQTSPSPVRSWSTPTSTGSALPTSLPGARQAGATTPQSATRTAQAGTSAATSKQGLFDLPDATPITVDGKASTAGALKRTIAGEIAAKAGPRRTVQAKSRVVEHAVVGAGQGVPVRSGNVATGKWNGGIATTTASAVTHAGLQSSGRKLATVGGAPDTARLFCTDKGPPQISEVDGTLTPGGKATVYGYCFGERAGHVEAIGNFPGGKLDVAFTGWAQTGIDLQVAANVRNTPDGTVAVTIVGADGRRSPAMQARFVATREQVEIPARLWTPDADFVLSATTDASPNLFNASPVVNPAASGHLQRSLRINPQCALESMSVDVLAGGVSEIRGFDQGPPNEAAATIDWTGTCIDTRTTTTHDYVVGSSQSVSIKQACSVALEPRAWAWCPAGLSP